jgi:hypothetical protein
VVDTGLFRTHQNPEHVLDRPRHLRLNVGFKFGDIDEQVGVQDCPGYGQFVRNRVQGNLCRVFGEVDISAPAASKIPETRAHRSLAAYPLSPDYPLPNRWLPFS